MSSRSCLTKAVCLFVSALPTDDLEEALLFDFEAEEAASLMAQTKTTVTSSLVSAAVSAGSLAPGGSLPSVLSGVRSITKDSTGTHVLTENFTLHIEEVREFHTAYRGGQSGSRTTS